MENERCIRRASRVILKLCFIGNQEDITNKLNVCIVISKDIRSNLIRGDEKSLPNERGHHWGKNDLHGSNLTKKLNYFYFLNFMIFPKCHFLYIS